MRSAFRVASLSLSLCVPSLALAGPGTVLLSAAKGVVETRGPREKVYATAAPGAQLEHGARVRTGADAEATLSYADGTSAVLKPSSEILVRVSKEPSGSPNGVVMFFGRIWSKVAKSQSEDTSFEVRTANAVAGVRGTAFETGVGLDGAVKVVVREGKVAVSGDDEARAAELKPGYTVVASDAGALGAVEEADEIDWNGWLGEHAKKMERRGLEVAKSLDGRLNKRRAKLEKLIGEQRALRKKLEGLEARKKRGEPVGKEIRKTFEKLAKLTGRIEDMAARLEGAFGLFEEWGRVAGGGGIADADKIAGMAGNIAKIAADFADMIEEGTDLSEEGMHELIDDMGKGKKTGPGDSAADELFGE